VLVALGAALFVIGMRDASIARADEDIKKAMQKINGGKVSLCAMINEGVKSDEPKWDELAEKVKVVVPLAKSLTKAKPPKGDDDSWQKFSGAYAKAAEDLESAVGKKDMKAAQDAMKTITDCRGCHTAHRVIKKKN
jgi:hypothetical protein